MAAFLLAAVLAVGAWQVIELHRQISDQQGEMSALRTKSETQQALLERVQSQRSGESGSLYGSQIVELLGQVSGVTNRLSQDENNTMQISQCVDDALNNLVNDLQNSNVQEWPGTSTC